MKFDPWSVWDTAVHISQSVNPKKNEDCFSPDKPKQLTKTEEKIEKKIIYKMKNNLTSKMQVVWIFLAVRFGTHGVMESWLLQPGRSMEPVTRTFQRGDLETRRWGCSRPRPSDQVWYES